MDCDKLGTSSVVAPWHVVVVARACVRVQKDITVSGLNSIQMAHGETFNRHPKYC